MIKLMMLIMLDPSMIVLLLGTILGCLCMYLITFIFKAIDHAMGIGPRRKGKWGL